MFDPYEEDDEDYDDDQYNYDYGKDINPYKFYFTFDVGNTPLSDWITNMINDMVHQPFDITNIPGFPVKKFPVNSWNPNTANNKFQYLGSNYQGKEIWKTKYFLIDKINTSYKMHLRSHAKYFLQQPYYYDGMFDILN